MTTSFAQDAIALLIDLAQRGEINPWDVQVIEVFDRCLSELASKNQKDLSRSGQAFLYASMLILLKAESLVGSESSEDESSLLEESLVDEELDGGHPLPLHLERCLRRRAIAQLPQKRRVTLNELISHLKLMAATVEEKTNRPRSYRPRRQSRAQAVRAISQLAHQENLLEVAVELEQYITQYWSQSQNQDWLDLNALLEFKNDRIGIFWALLFLSAQSKVELSQSEFYQDLKLRPFIPEAPISGSLD
jgi:segregation and condensation protein A